MPKFEQVESKLERSCVEVGANCVVVRAKLSRSSSEVVSKLERIVSKYERS